MLLKMLSECQTAWIWVRRRVTRRLIQIQAVCIWHFDCDLQAKGERQGVLLLPDIQELCNKLPRLPDNRTIYIILYHLNVLTSRLMNENPDKELSK